MSELEKLLESVAIECLNQPQEPSSGYLRDVRTVLWRRLLPLLEAALMSDSPQTGWLIERRNPEPEWCCCWSGGFEWTKDPLKAIRFCRREDANQVAELFEFEDVHITEHQWG